MTLVVAILTLLLLAAVIVVISGPIRRAGRSRVPAANQRNALEAAREAKYREIKDAELDFKTGKLSQEDYDQVRASLRAEALEILDRLAVLERDARE